MGTAKTAAPSSGLYFCLLKGRLCHPRVPTIPGHILKEFRKGVLLEDKQLGWPASCWCQFARLAFVIGTVVISIFHGRFLALWQRCHLCHRLWSFFSLPCVYQGPRFSECTSASCSPLRTTESGCVSVSLCSINDRSSEIPGEDLGLIFTKWGCIHPCSATDPSSSLHQLVYRTFIAQCLVFGCFPR